MNCSDTLILNSKWNLKSMDTNISIDDNELHIWKVKISDQRNNLDLFYNLITQGEQTYAKEYKFKEEKRRFIISRAITRKLIALYTEIKNPKEIALKFTKYGKPYIEEERITSHNITFNISHSKDVILFAFAKNKEIGIDIEFIDKKFLFEEILDSCCSHYEISYFKNIPAQQKHYYFYKLWVIKEAISKAIGKGLSYDIKKIEIDFSKINANQKAFLINVYACNLFWAVGFFSTCSHYSSAFAMEGKIQKVSLFQIKTVEN